MPEVVMPRLSDSMEEGTILRWLKAGGEAVTRGEALVEIETDKATMTYEADADGVLEILVAEGETLPVGDVIGRIGGADAVNGRAEDVAAPAALPTPSPAAEAPAPGEGRVTLAAPGNAARAKISPVARRIARERGVDPGALHGTGPGGRIVRADVEAASGGRVEQAAAGVLSGASPGGDAPSGVLSGAPAGGDAVPPAAVGAAAPADASPPSLPAPATAGGGAKGEVTVQEPTRAQQVIARRMAESRATVPSFTLQAEVDMEACVALRAQLKELAGEAPAPSYNDMVIRACALALRDHPRVNGSYRDGRFELHPRVNVGMAVASDDALVVPVVIDADRKGLRVIASEARSLAQRVREGVITPPELSGGTFTVSNLGMFGTTSFEAVINPPQAAIIAVGAVAQRPAVVDGEIVARHRMTITLACDHRILYGADAARFAAGIKALLERPLALLV